MRKAFKMLTWIILALIVAMVLWVRIAPSNVDQWHVDPETVEKNPLPNQFLMRDGQGADALVFDMSPSDLAAKFNEIALSKPNTTVLAGNANDLWVTYVQRTKLMAYPDYISVKVTAEDGGKSRLYVYSRSRFGRSDLGVNKARIKAWTAALGDPIVR
jgi:uncharacterized protein (DUF1499 family)